MSNKPTLDEILNDFRQSSIIIHSNNSLGRGENGRIAFENSLTEAKQQLTQLIDDIIGPDYDQYEFGHNDFDETKSDHLNNEHDEQRQRAKERGIDL